MEEEIFKCLEEEIHFVPSIRKRLHWTKKKMDMEIKHLQQAGKVFLEKDTNKLFFVKAGTIDLTKNGYGFIVPEDEEEDYFLPKTELNFLFEGDLVSFYSKERGKRLKIAKVISVLKRSHQTVIGEYRFLMKKGKRIGYLLSSDPKFSVQMRVKNASENWVEGSIVSANVIYSEKDIFAHITKVLGHRSDPGIEITKIALSYGFSLDFPKEVVEELKKIGSDVTEEEKTEREDFTDRVIFTIDGSDSKDFDDAVEVVENEDGSFRLGVYIADVSEYVKEGSALDSEAFRRGTSLYLADRVLPMLPHFLSNGICSLNEGVDRLVLACIMKLSSSGKLLDFEIKEGTIRSKHRMTYDEVNAMIEGDVEVQNKYRDIFPSILSMVKLSKRIRERRTKMGALDFDLSEYRFTLNEDGSPKEVIAEVRRTAEKMIEDFMLMANETVAYYMNILHYPCIYRVHEKPDAEKMAAALDIVRHFHIPFKQTKNAIHSKQIQEILNAGKETPYAELISDLILRSLQKAKYSSQNLGHFGLAMRDYCHFTSPIRRYPDLMVHRMLKKFVLHPGEIEKNMIKYNTVMESIALANSKSERQSVECERACQDMLSAWYMENRIGESFHGVVSSLTSFGFFVRLDSGIEGFVAFQNLKDYYEFDVENYRIVSENHLYEVGDSVDVTVLKASRIERTIDLVLEEEGI